MREELKEAVKELSRTVIVMMKDVWSVRELALVLNVSESRVRRLACDRIIPSYKQNAQLYFKRSEIEAWQTRHRTASQEELEQEAATYCALRRLRK